MLEASCFFKLPNKKSVNFSSSLYKKLFSSQMTHSAFLFLLSHLRFLEFYCCNFSEMDCSKCTVTESNEF
uniref:Uncharacterized protein n=1 Tax=Anguilla anguilla TaxID=7936 RepID=A0A0E9XME4_ANGAN